MQAVQLGFCPRLKIAHTSAHQIGQIYIAAVNWVLMVGCIALVVGFRIVERPRGRLRHRRHRDDDHHVDPASRRRARALELAGCRRRALVPVLFLVIDLAFFGANFIKIPHGGWFPLVVGAVVFTVMTTWKRGRRILARAHVRQRADAARAVPEATSTRESPRASRARPCS